MEERYSWVKTRYFLKDGEVCTLKSIAAVGLLWCTPVIPALGRQRQEISVEFKASLVYRGSLGQPGPQRDALSWKKQTQNPNQKNLSVCWPCLSFGSCRAGLHLTVSSSPRCPFTLVPREDWLWQVPVRARVCHKLLHGLCFRPSRLVPYFLCLVFSFLILCLLLCSIFKIF
jgi:hypothetical protein